MQCKVNRRSAIIALFLSLIIIILWISIRLCEWVSSITSRSEANHVLPECLLAPSRNKVIHMNKHGYDTNHKQKYQSALYWASCLAGSNGSKVCRNPTFPFLLHIFYFLSVAIFACKPPHTLLFCSSKAYFRKQCECERQTQPSTTFSLFGSIVQKQFLKTQFFPLWNISAQLCGGAVLSGHLTLWLRKTLEPFNSVQH